MASPADRNETEPIVLTLEAKFHRILDDGWNNKLIQFPKGGILWGLHLSKMQSGNNADSKLIGSLLCYGPMKEHDADWAIEFDHAFTLSCKRIGCASPIQKSSSFNRRNHVISAAQWGERKLPLPENWGIHDNVKLSCHMYINKTSGFDRDALEAAGTPDPLRQPEQSAVQLTSAQIEGQVMTCFSELLVEEDIEYTQEGFEAVEKLAKFFCFPEVLDVCRKHLMRTQAAYGMVSNETDDEKDEKRLKKFNLQGFDYPNNSAARRQNMKNLSKDDVIAIFQHLTAMAFKKG